MSSHVMSVAAALPHIYFLSQATLWQKNSEISPRPSPPNEAEAYQYTLSTTNIGGIAIKVIIVSFHIL